MGCFRDFEAEIFDLKSGRYLGSMFTSTREPGEPYKLGGELVLSDSIIYKNNSKRVRKCYIRKAEKVNDLEGKKLNCYNLYVEPTKEEVKLNVLPDFLKNEDWQDDDGYDGWLK